MINVRNSTCIRVIRFVIGVVVLVASNRDAAAEPSSDWPMFLGPTQNSKSSESTLWLDWPQEGPAVRWSRKLGESYGIGSVAGTNYYQPDYLNGMAQLLCLHRETGDLIWKYEYSSDYKDLFNYNSGPRASPVIDVHAAEPRVYFYGVDGHLACLNAATGDMVWKVDVSKMFGVIQNFFGVGSTPTIYRDNLIVVVGGSPDEDQQVPPGQLNRVSGNGSGIVAFDKRTGEVRYQLSDQLAGYASPIIVRRGERDWCLALLRGGLLAFDPATGKQAFFFPWRAKILESVNASNPVVWGDHVFISETYGPGSALLRFRGHDYDVVWSDLRKGRRKSMQAHWNTPIYHEGYIYGCSGRHSNNAELRCIEAMTGKVMWSEPGLTRTSLLYLPQQYFVCLGEDGAVRLIRVNPQKYELIHQFVPQATVPNGQSVDRLLKYPAWAAPILANRLLYMRGRDRVVCFDLRGPDSNRN